MSNDETSQFADGSNSHPLVQGVSPFGNAYYALQLAEGILELVHETLQYMKQDLAYAHNDYMDSQHFVGSVEAGIESLDEVDTDTDAEA